MKSKEEIYREHWNKWVEKTWGSGASSDADFDEVAESTKHIYAAMEEYAEQNCDQIQTLFTRPTKELKPLEDLYRKENPHPKGKFYLPDTTTFYKWIRVKLLGS